MQARTEAARERGWTIDDPAQAGAVTAQTTVETDDGPRTLMVDATSLEELLERIELLDRERGRL